MHTDPNTASQLNVTLQEPFLVTVRRFARCGGIQEGALDCLLKANMGHGITAAGIVGVIKSIESFSHNVIPAHRPVERLTTLNEAPFRLIQQNAEWQRCSQTSRCVGIWLWW